MESDSDSDLRAPGVTSSWGKCVDANRLVDEGARRARVGLGANVKQAREEEQRTAQAKAARVLQREALARARTQIAQPAHPAQPVQRRSPDGGPRAERARSRSPRTAAVSTGCRVRLRGLQGAAELNGQAGSAQELTASGRWRIKLHDGQVKDFKPENLLKVGQMVRTGCQVVLHSLKGAKQLNGEEGVLEEYLDSSLRWRVKLRNGQSKDLKPENLDPVDLEARGSERETCAQDTEVEPVATAEQDLLREFNLGFYIVCDPGVRVNDGAGLKHAQITVIPAGTRVQVIEVLNCFWNHRLRAKIAQPSGWMTLMDTSTGQRFALKDAQQLSTQLQGPEYASRGVNLKPGDKCGPGERFVISEFLGEGGYSTVWRCHDALMQSDYALKLTRATESKRRALLREIKLMTHLKNQADLDPEGSQYLLCLVFLEPFEHQGHLGVVFEPMKYNLLTALERHGRGTGLPLLPAVRNFGRHLFLALRALRSASLVHSDIKPENLLVAKDGASIKLADFGNSFTVEEAEHLCDENLMPRFYRAPEVILGHKLGTAVDMWGAGTTLYQMATDRFLFSGDTNNEVLHEMLMICGAFPSSMLSGAKFCARHFDGAEHFLLRESSLEEAKRLPNAEFRPPPRGLDCSLKALLKLAPPGVDQVRHDLLLDHFCELLTFCLRHHPKSRPAPQDVLKHRFFAKGAGDPFAELAALWAEQGATSYSVE